MSDGIPSRYTELSSEEMPDTPSRVTYQTDSELEASIFTCHSLGYEGSFLSSNDISKRSTESSTGSSEPESGSGTIASQLTEVPWQDWGPHNIGDITGDDNIGVAFSEIGSFNAAMGLKQAQWFLTHLMMEHESASHRLLAVSTNKT